MAKFGRTENRSSPRDTHEFAKVEKETYSVFVSSYRSRQDTREAGVRLIRVVCNFQVVEVATRNFLSSRERKMLPPLNRYEVIEYFENTK